MTNVSEFQDDFGFGGEEFAAEIMSVPYAQFLNSDKTEVGIAVTQTNKELAGFEPGELFTKKAEHFFSGENDPTTLYYSSNPRLIILNRSAPLMSDGEKTIPFDKDTRETDFQKWKVFSYAVIWLVGNNNQPLSASPMRIKCGGYAGYSFTNSFNHYANNDSFCANLLKAYKGRTGDRAINKNEVFYAHGVYNPSFVRERKTSSRNNQSSEAAVVKDFAVPTIETIQDFLIKNGSDFSKLITEQIEVTKEWLKTAPQEVEENDPDSQAELIQLTPQSNAFDSLADNFGGQQIPVTSISSPITQDNSEMAEMVITASTKLGWTTESLAALLHLKHRTTIESLSGLEEDDLVTIYGQIQDPTVIKSFNATADIPF